MPDLDERDLHDLFRTAGHHAPQRDLADRIMARVAVTPLARPVPVRPVIGTRGWIGIGTGTAVSIALAALVGDGTSAMPAWMSAAAERLPTVSLPTGDWAVWLAIGSGATLLFTYLDQVLRARLAAAKR